MRFLKVVTVETKAIYKIGDGKYDIPDDRGVRNDAIARKLKEIHLNEVSDFLDYYFDGCEYPKELIRRIRKYILFKDIVDGERKNLTAKWLENKVKFSTVIMKEIEYLSTFEYNIDNWQSRLSYFTFGRGLDKSFEIINYIESLMTESLALHNLHCTDPYGCATKKVYDNRMDYIEKKKRQYAIKKQQSEPEQPAATKAIKPIQWKGTQKELAELFIELKKKGWIEEHNNYEAIKACFTNSNTIHQVLKPAQDKKTKDVTYEGVYTPQYKPKFYGIQSNPKK